ncbi:MAG TPA: sugar phosphate isomerase/epimerase family protein [Pirellulaceae bacterium]|nr:sugar phosphate isomerase/epimerase family protein [Pirellulaceae bacterium]
MFLGYNTNGLAHHDPFQAIFLLANAGYRGVALTLDRGPLDPFASDWAEHLMRLRTRLRQLELRSVVETGARFLLDPQAKHEPTLVTADPQAAQRRIDFLCRAIDAAAFLGSDCVSLWSGVVRDGAGSEVVWERLTDRLRIVLEYAAQRQVTIGFEPEPGMFIDTMEKFVELRRRFPSPQIKLTLDVGHLHCQGEVPIAEQINKWKDLLVNIHIEDMRRGIHEHLMFGEGEMDFPPIVAALAKADYRGGIYVELSRHSHDAPTAVQKAYDFLHPLVNARASG